MDVFGGPFERVGDVEEHVPAVPVRNGHDLFRPDLLDDHVVVEDLDEVGDAGLKDVRKHLVEIVFGDHFCHLGVADVENIDIRSLLVVDDHRVCLVAGVPREDAVYLVGAFLPWPGTVSSPTPSASGVGCAGFVTS